ncbi:hypothetical protein QTO34_003111 [Cnephaeus nilssonii]|uniref:Uncharacterized protein n=1 Tax=Cnephaeus nilssonii TaxID=3371016 RepID=A0AA40LJP5_CNENI|nr:hypothetical protein QTO34_003111 [Eptesicus nilssonii]
MVRCDGEKGAERPASQTIPGRGRGERSAQLVSVLCFPEGAHTTLPSGPQNPPDDKKWCYPAHAWASDPGLLQVLLALTREYAALGTTTQPVSGIGSEG